MFSLKPKLLKNAWIQSARNAIWCPRQDSNLRPPVSQTGALSTELRGPSKIWIRCSNRSSSRSTVELPPLVERAGFEPTTRAFHSVNQSLSTHILVERVGIEPTFYPVKSRVQAIICYRSSILRWLRAITMPVRIATTLLTLYLTAPSFGAPGRI